ncbi:MAG: heavy-metal-associated domain-containing protein [Alphaproteobacteria bacterium]|nr:heavy-metal-associated domain-containing protein [Alphaproteobacteria bacterium]
MVQRFSVTGMTCQGCVKAVTRAVGNAAPQARVSVNLDRGQVEVDGVADERAVIKAITDAGFGASPA